MKLAVISPARSQGVTSVATLLAIAFAQTQNSTVCLTHTGMNSESINTFLGVKELDDKTRSLTQVVKLLESDAIAGEEIRDYCVKLGPNLDMMNTASDSLNQEESYKLFKFVLDSLNHDIVVMDIDSEVYEPAAQAAIDIADLVVMVISQSKDVLKKFEKLRDSEYFSKMEEKGIVYIINKFDPYINAFRDTTKAARLKHRRCCKITYNPFIVRTANMGKLHTIMPYIVSKDFRVVELHNDLKECLQVITANLGMKMDWGKR